ncbi:MAG: type II toxin-antitoxin system RelE/ParE family toxin [Gallionellaceae bacterium]|nr:type II toxin-antitoxin system RelE/ParE family toxin [Gallionellaceae bacterium]
MKVRWRKNAQLDLVEIDAHIRQENPHAANRVVSAIRQETVQLIQTPLVGRPGRVENTRELVMTKLPFIVAYQIMPSSIEILAVIHTARLWPENFPE